MSLLRFSQSLFPQLDFSFEHETPGNAGKRDIVLCCLVALLFSSLHTHCRSVSPRSCR